MVSSNGYIKHLKSFINLKVFQQTDSLLTFPINEVHFYNVTLRVLLG